MDLALIWGSLIVVMLFGYVLLDGVGLGVGLLLPTGRRRRGRDAILATMPAPPSRALALLGCGCVLILTLRPEAAHPIWHGVALPGCVMALGFGVRAFSAWGRGKAALWVGVCDALFFAASAVIGVSQGLVLGSVIEVVRTPFPHIIDQGMGWLTPLSLLAGVTALLGYALIGAVWLRCKIAGDLERRMRRFSTGLGLGVLALMVMLLLMIPAGFET